MYLRYFGLEHPPFARRPNPDVFFAQAERKKILKNLCRDCQQGDEIMLLTGQKESGKTFFCRLIRHRMGGSLRKVVYLENPVGSFDELLRKICLELGMPLSVNTEQDMSTALHNLLQDEKEKGRRILLLIDDAEKMFLATLERFFRLLSEVNEQYGVQAVLSGQPALNSSVEQLSGYCEVVSISSAYALELFSAEETGAYLDYRLRSAGWSGKIEAPLFSGKAVHEIFCLSQGLPGVVDGIAESALEKAAAAEADAVLPAHITVPAAPVSAHEKADDEQSGSGRKGLLLSVLLCLLVIVFFFTRSSVFSDRQGESQGVEQDSVGSEGTEIPILLAKSEESALPFVVEEEEPVRFSENFSKSQTKVEEPAFFVLPVPQRPDFLKKNEAGEGEEEHEVLEKEEEKKIASPSKEDSLLSPMPVLPSEDLKENVKESVQAASSEEVDAETLPAAKKLPVIQPASIIELAPGMKKTRPPSAQEPASATEKEVRKTGIEPPKQKVLLPVDVARGVEPVVENASVPLADKRIEAVQVPQIDMKRIVPLSRSADADRLFTRYLGAGNRWTREAYGDKFTVQLLVLSSDEAAARIKDMIVRDEYQEHKTRLYILRRETLPPTIFVCYGVYNSMDEARNARNTMPLFLRKHHPYALSISDVLAKARD